jgi:hypothetical protein
VKLPPVPVKLPAVPAGWLPLSLEQLAMRTKQLNTATMPACVRMRLCLSKDRSPRKAHSSSFDRESADDQR